MAGRRPRGGGEGGDSRSRASICLQACKQNNKYVYKSEDFEMKYFVKNMHLVKGGIVIVINYQ